MNCAIASSRGHYANKLVLIGGPHKSGTSLACASLESDGYCNPAYITSPIEFGHGVNTDFYLTRECGLARKINRILVESTVHEMLVAEKRIEDYLIHIFRTCGSRIVIKDPYMRFTAVSWARIALKLRASTTLFTTIRDSESIERGWRSSRFLSKLNNREPDLVRRLKSPLSSKELRRLDEFNVTHSVVPFPTYSSLVLSTG